MAEEVSHRRGFAKEGACMEAVQAGQTAIQQEGSQKGKQSWVAFGAIAVQVRHG